MDPADILLIIYAVGAAMILASSVPLMRGKIPRNRTYGFRTKKTLSDSALWYKTNRFAGKGLFITGILCLAGTGAMWICKEKLGFGMIGWIGVALFLVPVWSVTAATCIYLKKI